MTFQELFVSEKLKTLQSYLTEAREDVFRFQDDDILKERGRIHIAERLFQLIVDTMLDINQHFIKELNLDPVDDFQSTFYTLRDHGVLPAEFADRVAPAVGVRNRIVHRYETLDVPRFIKNFRKGLSDVDEYIRGINDYLAKVVKGGS